MPDEPQIGLGALEASAREVRLPVGLVLDSVSLVSGGGTVGFRPFEVGLAEPAKIEICIGEVALQGFLNRLAPGGLEAFRVQLVDGKATIDAVKRMIVAVPARATCSVRIVDGTKLFIDVDEVEMLGAAVKSMVQSQMDHMNPVVDLGELPWRVCMTEAVIDGGKLVLRGTATPRA